MRNVANSEDPDVEMPHNVTFNLESTLFLDKELQFYFFLILTRIFIQ